MIFYCDTPHIYRVSKLRLRVVPVNSPLSGHNHECRTLFRILAQFWWVMVNKEVAQLIRACAHFQMENSCSHESYQMLHTIDSYKPRVVVFLYFREPWGHPRSVWISQDTHMPGLYNRIWARSSQWIKINYIRPGRMIVFGSFFVPFGLPKIIIVDTDVLFLECAGRPSNKTYQFHYMKLQGVTTRQL